MVPGDYGLPEKSVPDRFESFSLSIERIGEAYRVRVTAAPFGPTRAIPIEPSALDVGAATFGPTTQPIRGVERGPIDRDDLRRRGEQLFRAVFTGPVAECFRGSLERVRSKGLGLRIRLQMDDAPELVALPWEALWDPTSRAFLNDQSDLPIARALNVTTSSGVGPEEPPLRLLALLPEPHGERKISGADEWCQIEDRLARWIELGLVEADRVAPPTLEALGSRIDDGPCDVLHVVAHGGPGDPGSGGLLKLQNSAGGLDPVTGAEIARALERRTPPRLVVLNACHGARTAVDDAFDGMAQHLLSRGISAVVAMRTTISDAAAVSFAAALYSALAEGRTIEAAVVEARRRLSLGEHRTEWATPVLYLRGDNVRIFDTDTASFPIRPSARSPKWIRRAAGAAAGIGLGALGVLMWPGQGVDMCPGPPGLQDLEFVRIDSGVVNLEGRRIVVEEDYCVSTKEVSRRDWKEVVGTDLPRPDWPMDWPITHVTSDDAEQFLRLLELRDSGADYSLPTPEQWEYAARAKRTTDYFFGDDEARLEEYGNCRNTLGDDGREGPAPVGSYKANPWGLYDVHGNVAEWVLWPTDAGPKVEGGGKTWELRMGGSYTKAPRSCSFSSSRSEVYADDKRYDDTGFRVVRLDVGLDN